MAPLSLALWAALLLEQVEGEAETEEQEGERERSDAVGQLLETAHLHGRVTTRTMPHGSLPEPKQEATVSTCQVPKPFFRNELGRV